MTAEPAARRYPDTDRNLALVVYGLLVAAILFAGVPALIAVIIAYAQRTNVSPQIAQHHSFQIRIFWVAFFLSLVAGVSGLTALILGLGDLLAFSGEGGWDRMLAGNATLADMRIDTLALVLIGMAFLFSVLTALWLIAAPAFGLIRLVNDRTVSQGAA